MKTRTREIPQDQWRDFLDAFSRQYRGRPVTVELLSRDIGAQTIARRLPLLGLTVEDRPGKGEVIEVMAGDAPEAHVRHVVLSPAHLWVKQFGNGEDSALEVESATGPNVIVDFREAAKAAVD